MDARTRIDLADGGSTVLHVAQAKEVGGPLVLVLPAMGVPAGYYEPFVDDLARTGVTAAVADYPGQGAATPRVDRDLDHGYTEVAHDWLPRVVAAARREHDGPLVGLGHSLGGHILLTHLAGDEPLPDAAVLIGAGTPFWRTHHGVKTLLQTQFMGLLTRIRRFWPGDRLGFGGRQPRTLIREWAAFARTGRLTPGGRPIEPALRDVRLPVLVVDLDGDHLAPPAAVDALVAKLPSAQVERFTFVKAPGDPGKPVSHVSFARSPEIIGERIAEWVLKNAQVSASGPE
ncbi:alpha/beta fold hydrolase [Janibacter alittae]|uniref:Alpha/beta fold hydrolase n=1 Tax=Janibacter alittae TaxID=3115209 RepID=A0ABZ2MEK8_9MICO